MDRPGAGALSLLPEMLLMIYLPVVKSPQLLFASETIDQPSAPTEAKNLFPS